MGIAKRQRLLLLIAPLFLSAAVLCGQGGQGQEQPQPPETPPVTVRVTGRVRLVGSSPWTELVITGTEREWRIDKEDRDKLRNLQQQTVTVEGEESSREMILANGRSIGTWYMLRNIRIIAP